MANRVELAHTIYNPARLGLTFAQDSFPKLAEQTSSRVQKLILALDCAETCFTGWKLYGKLQEKYKTYYEQHKERFNVYIATGGVTLLAIAAVLIKGTNSALTPKINLNDLLPTEALKNCTTTWKRPRMDDLVRGLFFVRIILNLGLVALQSKPYQSLLTALLQAGSLAKMSHPQWIQITRTYREPFKTMQATVVEGGKLEEFQQTVNELQTTFYLKTTSFEESDLKSKLHSVYNYSNQVFQGSSWSRYWEISTKGNGTKKEEYSSRLSEQAFGERLKKFASTFVSEVLWSFVGLGGSSTEASAQVAYSATLNKSVIQPSDISFFKTKLFHQDQMWQPYQLINWSKGWRQLQFFTPAQAVINSVWAKVYLS